MKRQINQRLAVLARRLAETKCWTLRAFVIVALAAIPAWPQNPPKDISNESLEDLMNITVTSVSKQKQKISRTAAAIFVITADDIRRSGATNIPDVLRMVPGVDVAQINASTWAVTVRGFNGRFSNKLLVLIDGRTLYTPTLDGTFWDVVDLPLLDIERIEVIRGPGGSIWGANAVNGVINIITKTAAETKGTTVETGAGNSEEGFATLQYGGDLGSKTDYRVYTKYFNQDHYPDANGPDGGDGWHAQRVGFRADTTFSAHDALTVEGDVYSGREGQDELFMPSILSPVEQVEGGVDFSGGFVQGIWKHTFSTRSDTTLQFSYQRYRRDDPVDETRGTLDLDFEDHFHWGDRQNIIWGLDYSDSRSDAVGSLAVSLSPAKLTTHLFSSFIQDEFAVVPDRLYVTVGTKLEHDYYNGFAAMPSVSAVWTPSDSQTFWTSISRAIQTPSAVDASIRLNFTGFIGQGGTPTVIGLVGNPAFKNEALIAYEIGYRAKLTDRISIDLATYYNNYADQLTTEPDAPIFENTPSPPHLLIPSIYENLMFGETQGLELFANWKVLDRWTLSPGYAFEQVHMHLGPGSQDTTSVDETQGSSPVHSAQLRSHLVLPCNLSWDTSLYFVDRILDPAIPAYTTLDSGFTWKWREGVMFNLVGQNLIKDRHLEYVDVLQSTGATLIKRSIYAKVTWTH